MAFIKYFLIALVVGWATRRLAKQPRIHFLSRLTARMKPREAHVLHYPTFYVWIAVLAGLGYMAILALVIYSRSQGNPTATWGVMALFGGAALLSFLAVIPYFTDRHRLSDAGILHSRWMGLRGREFIPWSEVTRVSYSSLWSSLVLHTAGGRKAYISTMMVGLPELAQLIFQHVPPDAVDKKALAVLGELGKEAAGKAVEGESWKPHRQGGNS